MLTHILLCCAGVTILLPTLPANYSPGVLGKQTKPSPDIVLKRGKGICDSHWQWKWQQLWAQLMGKHPASAPSQHGEAVEQTQSSPSVWDGGGELVGPMMEPGSCSGLVAVQCCVSSLCGTCAPSKAMASGSSQDLCWYSLCLQPSQPVHNFQDRMQVL